MENSRNEQFSCSEFPAVLDRMMNSAGPHWPTQYMSHSLAQRFLPLCATLTVINSVVLGREAFMPNSELPVVSGIHRKSWHVCFVEGHGEVMYFA